jgi:DNA-binding NarL/FixJ family response regulator
VKPESASDDLRIVVADDSLLIRAGVVRILEGAGWVVTAEVGHADALLAAVRRDRPNVAIVDIRMPPTHTDEGIRATRAIRAEHGNSVGILVLSQYLEPDFALRLLEDGEQAVGYLLKDRIADAAAFTDAVRRVAAGGEVIDRAIVSQLLNRRLRQDPLDALTERERDVLARMAEGRSNQAIADDLYLAPKTVEAYISSIFGKLGLEPEAGRHRRVLAVLEYLRKR